MPIKHVHVNDIMQSEYTYELIEPMGKKFHPDFKPDFSPKEMLSLGVFGGKYMTDCKEEFPKDWFLDAKLCSSRHDPKLNYFGINASSIEIVLLPMAIAFLVVIAIVQLIETCLHCI